MKNKFYLIILIFLVSVCNSEAGYYYSPPESLIFEDVNPRIKRKVQTRSGAIDKIPNQYKGKLIYNPLSSNNLVNYRRDRIYSSFYVATTTPSISSFHYYNSAGNKISVSALNVKEDEYTFIVGIGLYIYDAMALEFEYATTKLTTGFKENITDDKTEIVVNGETKFQEADTISFESYSYFLNMLFESNYSRFIPFFGFGIGIINYSLNETRLNGGTVATHFKMKPTFALNYFIGGEMAINNDFLISIKYKSVTSGDLTFISENKKPSGLKFEFKNNFISFGVKYIW
jgi:hypothetical protein